MKILSWIFNFLIYPFRWYYTRFVFDSSKYYVVKQYGTLNMYLHTLNGEYCQGLKGAIKLHEDILKHYENDTRFGEFVFVRLSDIL
jgi:hypothetical protein